MRVATPATYLARRSFFISGTEDFYVKNYAWDNPKFNHFRRGVHKAEYPKRPGILTRTASAGARQALADFHF
jgi:hypothetical protein